VSSPGGACAGLVGVAVPLSGLMSSSNVKGFRSFLGHVGFYRRFIQNFSQIARPLTRLLTKDASFVFTEECLQSCHTLKKALFGLVRLYTTILGGAKPPGRTVCRDVDRLSPRWTGSCMEKPAFTRVNLSDVRVIMAIMRVPVLELLC
jgi:hypothetical protein